MHKKNSVKYLKKQKNNTWLVNNKNKTNQLKGVT